MSDKYKAGDSIEIDYPFYKHKDEWSPPSEDAAATNWGEWTPGCRSEHLPPDDSELVADGMGKMLITVVDTFKPAHYPARVFYTRKWRDPDGNEFGKSGLHIKTCGWLTSRSAGFYHHFRLESPSPSQGGDKMTCNEAISS